MIFGNLLLRQCFHIIDRVQTLQLRSAEEGHQHRLRHRAPVGTVLMANLAGDHRLPQLLFSMVVIGADPFVIQEGEQLVPMRSQALAQPNAVIVSITLQPDVIQPLVRSAIFDRIYKINKNCKSCQSCLLS